MFFQTNISTMKCHQKQFSQNKKHLPRKVLIRKIVKHFKVCLGNWIFIWNNHKTFKNNSFKQFRQLTWCNVGIQYDWTERKYNLHTITAPIPKKMIDLCQRINELLPDILNSHLHGIAINSSIDNNDSSFKDEII